MFGGTSDTVGAMGLGQRAERGLANGEKLHPGAVESAWYQVERLHSNAAAV